MAISNIRENTARVRERIARAAKHVGRELKEITLVAVTKAVEIKKIKEAVSAGINILGENYIQEAKENIRKIPSGDKGVHWHFIGHLQKNKVKDAVELFDMIETVDSISLAMELNKRASKRLNVLIQVNLAKETTKGGIDENKVLELAHEIASLENLSLKGLMTIPPLFEDPKMVRPYFSVLRRLAERIRRENIPGISMKELSMGMSNDLEIAIEEGATIIRVGRAIFGEREKKG